MQLEESLRSVERVRKSRKESEREAKKSDWEEQHQSSYQLELGKRHKMSQMQMPKNAKESTRNARNDRHELVMN